MLNSNEMLNVKKDRYKFFNAVAIIRILLLLVSVFSSTIELGLSFSVLKIGDTASSIVLGLFIATVINIILLLIYLKTVAKRNNQSNFLIFLVEMLSSVYGILGIYAYIRYVIEVEVITVTSIIGMIGLIDLIIINVFIGSFFFQGKLNDKLVEFAIAINIIILIILGLA